MKGHDLCDYLGEDYCARCDSFLVERNKRGVLWCSVCWGVARPLPKRLRDLIAKAA
jgi:hypothetical protein